MAEAGQTNIELNKLNQNGETRFFLTGLDFFEDFDIVSAVMMAKFEAVPTDNVDSVYYREVTFEKNKDTFTLCYNEEIGVYVSTYETSKAKLTRLEKLLIEAIPIIEKVRDRNLTHNE